MMECRQNLSSIVLGFRLQYAIKGCSDIFECSVAARKLYFKNKKFEFGT